MFRSFFGKKPVPLSGAPTVRRQKSYSAESGFVYQYFYEGMRRLAKGTEFVFTFSADRKTSHAVSVVVSDEVIAGREILANVRYAIAKMALFQAFDERGTPELMKVEVVVRAEDVAGILEKLGLE